ncbi:winged helix-turn-helix transcriptional regulator [Streptomyces sp. NPDC101776]|uniref:winged helix-turn-helix transcriptional regulator n=1 Tax=Streptomyces sp. NPDC101776 TaxID=3366146 RepID=UPI00382181E0
MTNQPYSANPEHPELPPTVEALTHAFALLGRRWSGLVLAALARGPAGFGEVRERVPGISDRMLADRLHELAAAGLLTRTPQRSYALTPHGDAFLIPLAALAVWAEEHLMVTPTGTGGTSRRG